MIFRQKIHENLLKYHYWGYINNKFINPIPDLASDRQTEFICQHTEEYIFESDKLQDLSDGRVGVCVFEDGAFFFKHSDGNRKLLFTSVYRKLEL